MKKKVLFICTHNSARSQMAEGLLRAFYGDRYEAEKRIEQIVSELGYKIIPCQKKRSLL